jgi:hypothetical protein
MIEKTQKRLRQARFFYEHLLNPSKPNQEAYEFYFSAFIQAARSVTWTLGNEEKEKWEAWEPKWRDSRSQEQQKLLKVTTKLRNVDAKEGGVRLTMEFEDVTVKALIQAIPSGQGIYPHQRRRLPSMTPVHHSSTQKLVLPVLYFKDKDKKRELTDVCRQYLELLEKMVKDFCEEADH